MAFCLSLSVRAPLTEIKVRVAGLKIDEFQASAESPIKLSFVCSVAWERSISILDSQI